VRLRTTPIEVTREEWVREALRQGFSYRKAAEAGDVSVGTVARMPSLGFDRTFLAS
jgi:transposase